MDEQKEQIFENNPYWEGEKQGADLPSEQMKEEEKADNPVSKNVVKKTVPVDDKTTDNNPNPLDEPFPEVNVYKEEDAISFVIGGQTFKMVKVEGGTFTMGFSEDSSKKIKVVFEDEKPAHQVTLNSFYICDTTVTQELWKAVYPTADISLKKGRENLPKVKISWDDCRRFINRLNAMTGYQFRMPTEAEWEFAAKGGIHSKNFTYAGTDSLSFVGWYHTNDKPIQPVKKLKTNELGIYDMSGNIYEWCADWYAKDYYANSPENNPKGPDEGQYKVIRGGSVFSVAESCRISMRMNLDPKLREAGVGLRLAL